MLKCQSICSKYKESNLDSPEVLCTLISKFPGYVRERWNRRTHKKDHKLFDLPRFVEEESILVNDPLFSKEEVNFLQKQVQVVEDQRQDQVVEGRRISRKENVV